MPQFTIKTLTINSKSSLYPLVAERPQSSGTDNERPTSDPNLKEVKLKTVSSKIAAKRDNNGRTTKPTEPSNDPTARKNSRHTHPLHIVLKNGLKKKKKMEITPRFIDSDTDSDDETTTKSSTPSATVTSITQRIIDEVPVGVPVPTYASKHAQHHQHTDLDPPIH